jgi:SAM-dependent methyltransferase/uncharacterized protein YbaR (Trm112 family)
MIGAGLDLSGGSTSGLFSWLRCPATGAELVMRDGSLQTPDGEHAYPIVDGVPILIAGEKSLFDPANYGTAAPHPPRGTQLKQLVKRWVRRIAYMPPTLIRNLVADDNISDLAELLRSRAAADRRPRVLVVGGAAVGVGVDVLLRADDLDVFQTDILLTPAVAVVCDGHDLPFADRVFDAVVCQAVLEHVLDPQRVADEIWRVLGSGGLVYSEVPFMAQVHAGAFDFTRFTHLGHRRLWRRFDEIKSGADTGPGMALSWSILYFVRSLTPRPIWPAADRLVSASFFWLKYLDPWLVRKPAALDAAYGSFFLGTQRETPIADREIVNGYRGANGPRPNL